MWPPSQVPERTGFIMASGRGAHVAAGDAAGPVGAEKGQGPRRVKKRAAGPGGCLDAREADADRVLRELRPRWATRALRSERRPATARRRGWIECDQETTLEN